MSRLVVEMIDLSRQYCELIESSGADRGAWLRNVSELLPKLHATVTSLDGRPYLGGSGIIPDLDARFELYTHLRELLGDRDGYWLEFDRVGDEEAMTGSLADDLTDIYCELKHGLRLADKRPEDALEDLLSGFEYHWGRHLVDAERQLSILAAAGRLD
jgi:hypothetical protein